MSVDVPEADSADEPAGPTSAVETELRAALSADSSRVGDVYRGLDRGLSGTEIAEELGVETPNFVWNYRRSISALLEGDLPTAPQVALQTLRRFRTLLLTHDLSPNARSYVESKALELERFANDETARVVEVQRAKEQTDRAEAKNASGIYVYALPHYLRYPFEPSTGRTLMKVGRSDSDVIQRFRNQVRTTALPEEPILLRIYRTEEGQSARLEATFHALLEAADHFRSVARSAGREWFLTTTRFLDEIGHSFGLPAEIVNDSGLIDEP